MNCSTRTVLLHIIHAIILVSCPLFLNPVRICAIWLVSCRLSHTQPLSLTHSGESGGLQSRRIVIQNKIVIPSEIQYINVYNALIYCLAVMEDTTATSGPDSEVAASAADDDIPVPTTPLVFLCVKCKNIVGDSLAMVHSDQQHQQITLSGVSNIKWSSSVSTAKSGHDVGNTYFTFSCSQCEVCPHFVKLQNATLLTYL